MHITHTRIVFVALAAVALLTAPSGARAQSTTPRAAAPPPPARAQRPTVSPRPAPAPVVAPSEDVEPAEAPEAPETPEPPEPFEAPDVWVDVPEMPDFGDMHIDMSGLKANLDAMRLTMPAMAPMAGGFYWAGGGGGWQSRQRFDDVAKETDPARRTYLEGRNFVADSEWDKAASKFNEVVTKYGSSKIVDSALYWYAYSLKSESRYPESYDALQRLLSQYPSSRWSDDAKQLLAEVAGPAGKPLPPDIQKEYDERLKIVALRSIFESQPDQAVGLARGYFKPGSTASQRFKQQVTMLLAEVQSPAATDLLIEIARTDPDPKVKKQALLMLGQRLDDSQRGEQVFNLLRDLASGTDTDTARIAVVAIAQDDGERSGAVLSQLATSAQLVEVRKQAIAMLGERRNASTCATLVKIYDTEKEPELRRLALVMLGQSDCPQALDKLMQVARTGDTVEARRFAMVTLAQKDRGRAVETLSSMYASEKNETLKGGIVDGLGQIVIESSDKAALQKLMSIAKSEPSLELKRKAIFWIGQSKDPEATQFLVDLLK